MVSPTYHIIAPVLCSGNVMVVVVERERDACDVIDNTLKSRVIIHMITSTARSLRSLVFRLPWITQQHFVGML